MTQLKARSVIDLMSAALCLGWASPATPQVTFERMSASGRDIRMTEIAKGIYQFTTMRDSYVRQLNSIAIVNRDDVLVFDTNTRPSSANVIIARIRAITRKPVRYVVNSHGHPDHWSGNEAYARAFPGLDIIATNDVAANMRKMAGVWLSRFEAELAVRRAAAAAEAQSGRRADGSIATPDDRRQDAADLRDYASFVGETRALHRIFPTITYSGELRFTHGGREFRLISVTGDQEGTTVLYLPRERILLAGDAVSFPIPYVSLKPLKQIASLQMLETLDIDIIVPGHGPAFRDKKFLQLEIALFLKVAREVDLALAEGKRVSRAEVVAAVAASELLDVFTHGDRDLETRFRARVSDAAGFVYDERVAEWALSRP
jgi:glyoxylase-like metal-dependent hydrolase (beta-lactamase superfamily II)